jgi:uncharacterized protein (TIGR02611 family)
VEKEPIHPVLARLRARRDRHAERGRVYRIAFAAAGFAALLAGIAMLVLPGPGLLVIAIGLAMLALEFAWAEHLLARAVHRLERTSPANRWRAVAVGAAVATAVAVATFLWGDSLMPF